MFVCLVAWPISLVYVWLDTAEILNKEVAGVASLSLAHHHVCLFVLTIPGLPVMSLVLSVTQIENS